MPIALAHLLPTGIKGVVCAMILMGVISGDGIHLHSWSSILVQDVLMPLRTRPLPMGEHLRWLRAGIVGVAIFAFCFGALFKQTEYVLMWFQVTTAIFVGGAGSAIIGGLYWKRGTTAGAWVGLITGSTLCISGILARQWNPDFPLNGTQISFYAALISIAAYVLVSLVTCRAPHDMDRLLHRGIYAVEPEGGETVAVPLRRFSLRQIIGIDEHFTRSDRWVAYGLFGWSTFWFLVFVVGSTIYLIHPFSNEAWAQYWRVTAIWLPLVVTIVTTIWFTIGCTQDLRRFFQRLRGERVDVHDDGTVEDPAAAAPETAKPVMQPLSPGGIMRWREQAWLAGGVTFALLLAFDPSPRADSQSAVGTDFDLQGFIDHALAAGKKEILVPPGHYRVKPQHAHHLFLKNLDGVKIVADGVEMICTETTNALTIANCTNVTIRGLVIDYDPLPYTQGRITALSADKKVHDIELFDGYPDGDLVTGDRYEVYARDTRVLRCATYSGIVEKLDAKHFRFTKRGLSGAGDFEQVGDLCVMGAKWAPGGSAPHAVESDHCRNLRLDSVTVYASNCFGYLEHNGDGNTYYRCKLDRCPPVLDLVRRGSPRLRSTNADAFHSKFAVTGPSLLECTAKFQGDDCVNICGAYHMITACHGAELRVLANGDFLKPNEGVELLTYTGERLPDARVVAIVPDGMINAEEDAFRRKQKMNEEIRTRPNVQAYRVTLDRAVDVAMGSLICSTARVGNGFVVQGCDFGFNRSRGILIKASNGRVVGNTIAGSWMEAIKVSPEYWWLEAGSSDNVEISGNTIKDCRSVGIAVYANGGAGQVAPSGAHHRIAIIGNTISGSPLPNIAVTSTAGLQIERNLSAAPVKATPESNQMIHFMGLDDLPLRAVMWKNCVQITEAENEPKS